MGEEGKIEQSADDSQLSMENKVDVPEPLTVTEQPQTENSKLQTEEMEVHHPKLEKKSFKEYVLEGLMIFIAVSLGFIAENIREGMVEKETERTYAYDIIKAYNGEIKVVTKEGEGSKFIINLPV